MMAQRRVLIVAGEASGDLYGSLLIGAMSETQQPGISPPPSSRVGSGDTDARVQFTGVGGPAMRAAGLRPLGDAARLGVTGFLEILGSAGAIWHAYRQARDIL